MSSRARVLGLLATRVVAAAVACAAVLLVGQSARGGHVASAGQGVHVTDMAQVEPAPGYYESAMGLAGEALREALHEIVRGHTRLSYGGEGTDAIRAVLERAQEDLSDPTRVRDIYRNMAWLKVDERSEWDREHAWPSSYGFPGEQLCNVAFNDAHNLFAADDGYNSSRGNKVFDDCEGTCTPKPVEPDAPGEPTPQPNLADSDSWEVWPRRRGDIARAILYMDVRYEGGNATAGCPTPEPQLVVTDDAALVETSEGGEAYMGMKSTLLRWHMEDPVDDWERRRNDEIALSQHNRNPFIDHPHFACFLFGLPACGARLYLPFTADDHVWSGGGAR